MRNIIGEGINSWNCTAGDSYLISNLGVNVYSLPFPMITYAWNFTHIIILWDMNLFIRFQHFQCIFFPIYYLHAVTGFVYILLFSLLFYKKPCEKELYIIFGERALHNLHIFLLELFLILIGVIILLKKNLRNLNYPVKNLIFVLCVL